MDRIVLALDIGGTKVLGGLVTGDGRVLHSDRVGTDASSGPDAFLAWLVSFARRLCADSGVGVERIAAVGVAAPGLVDRREGIMTYAPHSGWRDVAFGPYLARHLGLPCVVANDVNACACGEMSFGSARGVADFAWMTVSTGIGGAVVVGGRVYEGAAGIAGEFGHLCVEDDGPRCPCGNRGCLEAVASGSGIARRARELGLASGEGTELTAEDVARLADGGNECAQRVYHEAGAYIGKALSYIVNILNPKLVVIGGGVSQSLHLLMPSLRSALVTRAISDENRNVPVLQTGLGYGAGLIGAAAIALAR